jgi:hypothetical protein
MDTVAQVDAPYEAARTRVVAARHVRAGDDDAARMEPMPLDDLRNWAPNLIRRAGS